MMARVETRGLCFSSRTGPPWSVKTSWKAALRESSLELVHKNNTYRHGEDLKVNGSPKDIKASPALPTIVD